MKITNFQKDLETVKRLLKFENYEELKRLSEIFLPEYNKRLFNNLDPWEQKIYSNILN